MDKKNVLYISGSRADFGRALYILKALENHRRFNVQIAATCAHVRREFGYTMREIEQEFDNVLRVPTMFSGDDINSMLNSLGRAIIEIAKILATNMPDLVMVLGDRGEMLAGAVAGKHFGIPVAHVAGGHKSGSIDNKIRDAITVFSDLHFVASKRGRERVLSIGADPNTTHVVGAPDLEAIRLSDFMSPEDIANQFKLFSKPSILLSLHPTVCPSSNARHEMELVCECLGSFSDVHVIATSPNADAGGQTMQRVLEYYSQCLHFSTYTHIQYRTYLGLMNVASVIVGNSSAGLIEAPSFGLPAVNIGERQTGRERAASVIDCTFNEESITDAINQALYDETFIKRAKKCINPFGDGNTSKRVAAALNRFFSSKMK